jgi:hypothetical protein
LTLKISVSSPTLGTWETWSTAWAIQRALTSSPRSVCYWRRSALHLKHFRLAKWDELILDLRLRDSDEPNLDLLPTTACRANETQSLVMLRTLAASKVSQKGCCLWLIGDVCRAQMSTRWSVGFIQRVSEIKRGRRKREHTYLLPSGSGF